MDNSAPDALAISMRVPGESETGDVGHGVDVERSHRLGGTLVEVNQRVDAGLHRAGGDPFLQVGVEQHAAAERFGQDQRVALAGPAVAPELVGVHDAQHRESELRFVVLDRMPSGKDRSGLGDLAQCSGDDAVEVFGRQFLRREADQVQADLGYSTHGVDVADGVGRGDLAVLIGIVNRRRDEIGRDHDGDLARQPVDAGVIAGLVADQQVRIIGPGQTG